MELVEKQLATELEKSRKPKVWKQPAAKAASLQKEDEG